MSNPDPAQFRQAIAELRDVNKDKRRTAVMKLGMLGGEEAVKTLITLIRNPHEDLIVRGRAALMLGRLGDRRAVDPLIEALDAPGYQTPLHAAESLGLLGDPRAIEPLRRMMDNHHDNFRKVAATALQKLGCDTADAVPYPAAALPPSPPAAPHIERLNDADDLSASGLADAMTEPQPTH